MAVFILFLGTFLISLTGFGSGLRLVQNPQPFTSSTEELNVSCIADNPTYLVKSILSIQIMRQIEDKPIAVIDVDQDLKMAVGTKDNVKAQGHIVKNSTGSYLTLIIDKPHRQDAGAYRCQMFFIDENFLLVEKNVNGNVTYQGCPYGWSLYQADKQCLKAFGARDFYKHATWSKAREECQAFGGDLVEIYDEEKNKFVYNLFVGAGFPFPWIGIKNAVRNDYDFKYLDGSDLGYYHPWQSGQPDGVGDNECVYMAAYSFSHGEWVDASCSNPYPYVCSTTPITVI